MDYKNNSINITKVITKKELNKNIDSGIRTLAEIIGSTLGPRGKNVIINNKKNNIPFITNDGATIAKSICLEDDFEDAAVQLIKQAALKTESDAGDGTSTAIVLTWAIIRNTRALIEEEAKSGKTISVNRLKRELDYWLKYAIKYVGEVSVKLNSVEQIRQIATISANNDEEIGKIIADAIELVGNEGIINVEESVTNKTKVVKVEGMEIEKPILSPYFITNPQKGTADFNEDTYILLIDDKVYQLSKILPALQIATENNKPILIIAESVDGEALSALVVNAVKGNLKVCAIQAPHHGDERRKAMEDIAKFTGATVLTSKYGLHTLDNFTIGNLGEAKRVVASKTCVIQEGKGKNLEAYKNSIKYQLEDHNNKLSLREKKILNLRLANLSTNVAILKVGASTDTEMIEKKMRIDDAIRATRCAIDDGVVAGGGMTFINIMRDLRNMVRSSGENAMAHDILIKSLKEPTETIIRNCGDNPLEILSSIYAATDTVKFNGKIEFVYDANIGKIVKAFEAGIIDPAKVIKSALKNAVSIAGMIITTSAAIIYDKKKNKEYSQEVYEY